ncbi:MAG: DUF2155 domain-containing protein [Pseudomonadota bacterium]
MLSSAFALLAALQTAGSEPEELLGWTVAPPAAVEGQETELDRLSRSASGQGFGPQQGRGATSDGRDAVSVTLRALDKVTARFVDLTVPIGEAETFGNLTLVARTCSTRPPEEFPETTVFLEVYADENDVAGQRVRVDNAAEADEAGLDPLEGVEVFELEGPESQGEDQGDFADSDAIIPVSEAVTASIDSALYGDAIFKGWMFASSPALNALEHPTYDVWVISCKMADPPV